MTHKHMTTEEIDAEIADLFDTISYDKEDLEAWRQPEPDEYPEDRVAKNDLLQLIAGFKSE